MNLIIILFGALIAVAGGIILLKPDSVFGLMRRHAESLGLHILAVVVRLVLGIALITYAAESRYPLVLAIIGWISLAAAVVLAGIGRARFKRLMNWALGFVSSYGAIGGLMALVFGGFLVFAVV